MQNTREKVQETSTKMQVEWRRRQVFELSSKGQSQTEIGRTLQISESTISRDLDYLRQQSKDNIKRNLVINRICCLADLNYQS
jgi:DNA-directed RNA polymerase specialized sigma subunit